MMEIIVGDLILNGKELRLTIRRILLLWLRNSLLEEKPIMLNFEFEQWKQAYILTIYKEELLQHGEVLTVKRIEEEAQAAGQDAPQQVRNKDRQATQEE